MASKYQREIALAAVTVVVLTVAVLVYRGRTMGPEPAPAGQTARPSPAASTVSSGPTSTATSRPATSKVNGLSEVDLQALNAPRGELQDTVRDPFRFKPKPPPPPPPTPVVRPTTQATAPVEPPPPPRIALKFFGAVESKKGQLAALSDGRGVYYGRVGDTIEGRYRILRIGVESIDLAYLDGRGRQTIRQTGQ